MQIDWPQGVKRLPERGAKEGSQRGQREGERKTDAWLVAATLGQAQGTLTGSVRRPRDCKTGSSHTMS